MSLLKYYDFLTEQNICDLLLESRVVYSPRFINILSKMSKNKVSNELISLYSKDIDVQHNYIDITDQKDAVSFTPDRRIKELIKDREETYIIESDGMYLTHGSTNDKIFARLGYVKEGRTNWSPAKGTIGKILSETISKSSGKIYVLFEEVVTTDKTPRLGVVNKLALRETNLDDEDDRVWKTSRNNIKVGRLVRSILTASKVQFVDKDIEDFTNQYKATFDFINNALLRFEVVTGDDITHWYNYKNYSEQDGTLGSSCMMEKPSDYFKIYSRNPDQVSMVILYDDEGTIIDGKYKSALIKGRAILWNAKIEGLENPKFMDRIYTVDDSDVDLFKQFADKNGFWYKTSQNSENECQISNGVDKRTPIITVNLKYGDFNRYPYLDTLCYLDTDGAKLSNIQGEIDADRELNDTGGGYDEVGNYRDDD